MRTPLQKRSYANSAVLLILASAFLFYAYSTGITGVTKKNGNGCDCHDSSPSSAVTVIINGPDSVVVNDTAVYTVTISGGPLTRGGTNIAASGGNLIPGEGMQKIGDEITHVLPKTPSGGTVTFQFNFVAPSSAGTLTLYANGNSVNFNGQNTGDQWNYADDKIIHIVDDIVPVELSNFTASVERNNVNLKWFTVTETNNYGFELQRSFSLNPSQKEKSFETAGWRTIAFIKGKGNSTEKSNYFFEDNNLLNGKYSYRLKQVDLDGTYKMYSLKEEIEINIPGTFVLNQNYPNPFNPETNISFVLPEPGNVQLKIYNSAGEESAVLEDQFKEAGYYSYKFNASEYSSGVYYYSLKISNQADDKALYAEVKKMILIK